MKSCKLPRTSLAPRLARDGDEALVAGYSLGKPALFVATLDLSAPLAPKVVARTAVPVPERADAVSGVVVRGEHALVSGYYIRLKVLAG